MSLPIRVLERRETPAAIVLLGFFVRVSYLLLIAHKGLMSDAASYVNMASDIAQGRQFVPFWPPGVPLYLAAVERVVGASTPALRIAMLPFYFGTCAALYRLTHLLTGRRSAASLALLPLAFAPEMVCLSVEPLTEIPTAMFLTVVAVYLLRYRRMQTGGAVALGAALGSLALLRPASLLLLVAVPLYLLWRSRSVVRALIPSAIGVAMVCAWIAAVHQQTGQFILINTANAKNVYLGNNPNTPLYRTWWLGSHHELENAALPAGASSQADPIALNAEYSRVARSYIVAHPGLFLVRSFNRVCVFFAFNTFTGAYLTQTYHFSGWIGLLVIALDAVIYIAIGIGAIRFAANISGFTQRSIDAAALFGLCAVYALPYFLAFSHPRYHIPIEPVLMALCASFYLSRSTAPAIEASSSRHRRSTGVVLAIVIFLAVQLEFFVIAGRAHS